jgi:hypothetical protein
MVIEGVHTLVAYSTMFAVCMHEISTKTAPVLSRQNIVSPAVFIACIAVLKKVPARRCLVPCIYGSGI